MERYCRYIGKRFDVSGYINDQTKIYNSCIDTFTFDVM